MEIELFDLTFEGWVRHIFDHQVTDPRWYWEDGCDYWNSTANPAITVAYLTRLFQDPVNILSPYSDEQIEQGLRYLVNNSCSDYMFAFLDDRVSLKDRLTGLNSIFPVFEQMFAIRCSAILNRGVKAGGPQIGTSNPLDDICYMWWDIFPFHGSRSRPDLQATSDSILDVMTRILHLPSDACQESALHGLGHWNSYDPRRTTAVIDEFLAATPNLRPELLTYARSARIGYVQ